MSEEPAVKPKRTRRSRAVPPSAPLPITATIHLKGRAKPLVMGCFQATQTPGGWRFLCPSETHGMVKTVHVSNADVVELDQWPEAPVFREAPSVALEAPPAPAARRAAPSGPQVYANPYRVNGDAQGDLPENGRPLGSFSVFAGGTPENAVPAG